MFYIHCNTLRTIAILVSWIFRNLAERHMIHCTYGTSHFAFLRYIEILLSFQKLMFLAERYLQNIGVFQDRINVIGATNQPTAELMATSLKMILPLLWHVHSFNRKHSLGRKKIHPQWGCGFGSFAEYQSRQVSGRYHLREELLTKIMKTKD